MSVEIDGVIYRTERAWEKKHRHVLKRQLKKGIEREWNSPRGKRSAVFYSESQTRPWPENELKREKRERAEQRRRKEQVAHDAAVTAKADAERQRFDLEACWGIGIGYRADGYEFSDAMTVEHTAWQWCDLGFVPISEARWEPTYYDFPDGESKWFYCPPWDVRWNPARAVKLKETGPQTYDELPDGTPYDGRPWW